MFLQATRILDRKGVELAIDLVAELEKPARRRQLAGAPLSTGKTFNADGDIVLLCAGIVETIGISGDYWSALQAHAKEKGVDLRHVGDRVAHSRGESDGQKIYSLWDSYVQADFVTYPSLWEGWGNQFIEAVFAKLPVVLFEYPVWKTDLGPAGFDVVSLGGTIDRHDERGLAHVSERALQNAADEVVEVLTDTQRRQRMVEQNFDVGRTHFGYDALEKLIRKLMPGA
jgi:glycosyltransferase involved in cell wall biosynthesis